MKRRDINSSRAIGYKFNDKWYKVRWYKYNLMSAKGQFEQHDVFAPSASLAKAYCSSWCLEDGEIVKNVSASFHGRPEDYDACQAILDVVKLPY